MDFLKRFFGFHNDEVRLHRELASDNNRKYETPHGDIPRRNFDVFTDPLQMHQYFEQQINEVLKSFGFQEFNDGLFSEFHIIPAIQDEPAFNNNSSDAGELRDQFLKSGYEKPTQIKSDKVDQDIDGKVNVSVLDSVFGKTLDPNEKHHTYFSIGQSQSVKTVRKPDGSIETHRIFKDNEGNEETTICQKLGDKEYCIIKKKNKEGNEEIIENFVNMDESQKDIFAKLHSRIPSTNEPHSDFLFDKFFK